MVEWLGQFWARRCGLPVPDCYAVELAANPGVYLFGSRWEGGNSGPSLDGSNIALVSNQEVFSAAWAFDLLIHNVDRHLGNFLYLTLAGELVVKVMDHGRSMWFSGWPLPAPPPVSTSKTCVVRKLTKRRAKFDRAEALRVVAAWSAITKQDVVDELDSLPQAWVDPARRAELESWWGSEAWVQRSQAVIGAL